MSFLGLFDSTSKSNSSSTTQSLNLGDGTALQLGDLKNLKEATFYLPVAASPPLFQSITNSPLLPYAFLAAAGYLAFRMLR